MKLFVVSIFIFYSFVRCLSFSDVADSAGISVPGDLGATCVFFDANNDNYPDLIFNSSGVRIFFFMNNQDGTFTNKTTQSGLFGNLKSVVSGDYNNDSFLDILGLDFSGTNPPFLFRNNGDTTFTEIGAASGLTQGGERGLFADYDRDGFLDVLIIDISTCYLYKNNTGTNFTLVYTFPVGGNSGSFCDFNNDGFPDLYIVRDGENKLYKNNGDGTFSDITTSAGVGDSQNSQAAAWGDFDNDLDLDLYLTNIASSRNTFYQNNGDETFSDVTIQYAVYDAGDGRTCKWIDYDNDGDLDIYTTNHINPSRFYRNMGVGAPFFNVAGGVNMANPKDVFAASWADYDRDGDLDAFLTGHFTNGYTLKRNDGGNELHYLEVKLMGVQSNISGFGASILLFTPDGNAQLREVHGGEGKQGHNDIIQHFGVGNNLYFDSLKVVWPSGTIDLLLNLPTDTFLMIKEGSYSVVENEEKILKAQDFYISGNYLYLKNARFPHFSIEIFDVCGRKMHIKKLSYSKNRVNLNNFGITTGVYFIKIQSNDSTKIIKYIKFLDS